MKFLSRCIVCAIEDIYQAMESLNLSEERKRKILNEVLKEIIENSDENQEPSMLITLAHRLLKKNLKVNDPFRNSKKVSLKVGRKLAIQLSQMVKKMEVEKRLKVLIKASAIANSFDIRFVGIGYKSNEKELEKNFWSLFEKKLIVDQSNLVIKNFLKGNKKIAFLLDNVGELPIDSLLIKELSQSNKVVTIARSEPITSDATILDVKRFSKIEKFSTVMASGSDTLGIIFEQSDPKVIDLIKTADIVIGKGQANFYTLYDKIDELKGNVVSIMYTKCDLVSKIFGSNKNGGVVHVLK